MNEMSQLASAMLTIFFAAIMLVAGEMYIKSRATQIFDVPAARTLRDGVMAASVKPSQPAFIPLFNQRSLP